MEKRAKFTKNLQEIIDNLLEASTRDNFDYLEFIMQLASMGFGEKYTIAKLGSHIAVVSECITANAESVIRYNETIFPLLIIMKSLEESSTRIGGTNFKALYV